MSTNRNKNRRQLPPLNALRAFEAVARFLSFTKAADELLVTQSAVSRQVKNLEDILGVALILRKAQLELTEEGKRLLPVLTDSFDRMDVVIGSFRRQSKKPPLSLAVPPTFARRILLPRLADFQRANSDLEIRIETPPVNPDFRNSGHDMAILFGEIETDGLIADVLMRETSSPLASPELIKKSNWPDLKTMIAKAPLLHIRQGNDSWHDWRMLARQVGFAGIPVERGVVVETADQAVQAAISGGGVVEVDPRLFAEELASGQLVPLFDISILTGRAYTLVCRPDETDLARIAAFRAWAMEALVESLPPEAAPAPAHP
ncbi:LysR substrate-binding domain-containing protein [Dongia sp.]|uniref:LysR substrate-binding domain-containing protein n=1 Tax=Dongia sp. TaxID=1977262 RepID=UPI0034A25557